MLERRRLSASLVALLAAGVLFALFLVNVLTLAGIHANRAWISRAREVQVVLGRVRAALVDAETSQRGFLLTGQAAYLEPFKGAEAALPPALAEARRLTANEPWQAYNMTELANLISTKMDELKRTVDTYRGGQPDAALAMVRGNQGKLVMDEARQLIGRMSAEEDQQLADRTAKGRRNLDFAMWIGAGAGLGLLALGFILFAINRDVTRREQLERALREEARFQQQFIGILGHDLRNPLNAIAMVTSRLQRPGELSPEQSVAVGRIESSSARMNRMIEQLLDLTRARIGGGIQLEPSPRTDISEIVSSAVEELRAAHPQAQLTLEAEREIHGPWDPDRIAQVVSNLVANAILYGVGPVEVSVKRADRSAVLEVHNGGPPIPADLVPHIFEAFRRRTDHATETRGQGLGLGLYIAEQIVLAHGGRIAVRSGDAEGTTFTIHLPAGATPV